MADFLSSGELEIAIRNSAPTAQDLLRSHANDIAVSGNHDQYIITRSATGQAIVRDSASGRDETTSVSKLDRMYFKDGVGLSDPTGTAAVVTRLYQAAFNRTPDIAGLSANTDIVTSNHATISELALSFTKSPEFISSYGALDNAGFVRQLYQNVLHRVPDEVGRQQWLNFANSGASRGAILEAFADSQENHRQLLPIAGDKNDAEATRLYQAALNRAPDDQGLATWSGKLAQGSTPEQVATGFVESAEFKQVYGTLSSSEFVTLLYKNVLHRTPDAPGLQNFVSALSNGASREQILVGFSDSTENRANTASATHDGWVFIHQ